MHEITGRDCVLLVEGHPLSGMGNWHGLAETVTWDSEIREGLADEDVRRTVPVFEPQPAPLAALIKRVKESFDPLRVLNPGRMVAGV